MIRRRWTGRVHASPLRLRERLGLIALALVIVAFGAVTLKRSAHSQRRMTDADVYFRASWAVRVGLDPYDAPDTNGWTYLYPPLLAILLAPLAQEPPDELLRGSAIAREHRLLWNIPYGACIVIWYAIGVLGLVMGTHWCARAWEIGSIHPRTRNGFRTRRWWVLRVLPVLVCLPAIGSTLVRGQVNTILLACVGGAMLLLARGQRLSCGLAIGSAVCLKLFPAYLLLHSLLTRSWRTLAGAAGAVVLLVGVFPMIVMGPTRGGEMVRTFARVMLMPALGLGGSDAKREELQRAFNNQSLLAILHNWRDWRGATFEKVIDPNALDQALFLLVGGTLTLLTLWIGARAGLMRRSGATLRVSLLCFALLVTLMLALSPVCHNHYFVLHLPLLTGLIALTHDRARSVDLWPGAWVAIALYMLAGVLPRMPGLEMSLKPLGVHMLAGLCLWALGARELWRIRTHPACPASAAGPLRSSVGPVAQR